MLQASKIACYNNEHMDPTNNPDQQQPPAPTPQTNPMPGQQPLTHYQQVEAQSREHLAKNPLASMQDGEQILADIHRHPFGIISVYITSFIAFAAACGVILLLVPKLLGSTSDYNSNNVTVGLIVVVMVLMLIGLTIMTIVYWQNRWVLTSDSLTQITQNGLFNRQTSQLSLGNLEDVTAEQRGIIPSLFNFGTLRVETAGEHSKFFFLYCPDPNLYARKILMARELFLQNGGENR